MITTLTNTQLAKLWTGWFVFTFGWGFWHGYNQIAMSGIANWIIQVTSVFLTMWVVGRLWRIGP
tara:strand:+ start:60 stop:251 length:192 start_codon:yes stop_codon:yes gene_type:complete